MEVACCPSALALTTAGMLNVPQPIPLIPLSRPLTQNPNRNAVAPFSPRLAGATGAYLGSPPPLSTTPTGLRPTLSSYKRIALEVRHRIPERGGAQNRASLTQKLVRSNNRRHLWFWRVKRLSHKSKKLWLTQSRRWVFEDPFISTLYSDLPPPSTQSLLHASDRQLDNLRCKEAVTVVRKKSPLVGSVVRRDGN